MPHHKLETLTRLGFAARGILYLLIAFLLLSAGRAEDGAGALEYLNGGAGKPLLTLLAVGFVAYGLWRLADAWLDSEGHGSDGKGMAMRAGAAVSGVIHLGLAWLALSLALGDAGGSGGGDGTREGTATALSLPGGQLLVLVAAAALLLVGFHQVATAAKASFLRHLDGRAASAPWVKLAGRIGYAARGLVFLMMAWFFGRAGLDRDAGEAGGMGDALASLPQTIQLIVGVGLLLFGLFSLVEARHRRIHVPDGALGARNPLRGRRH